MAVKKQPDPDVGELSEAANHWIRTFLNSLEDCLVETGQRLDAASEFTESQEVARDVDANRGTRQRTQIKRVSTAHGISRRFAGFEPAETTE